MTFGYKTYRIKIRKEKGGEELKMTLLKEGRRIGQLPPDLEELYPQLKADRIRWTQARDELVKLGLIPIKCRFEEGLEIPGPFHSSILSMLIPLGIITPEEQNPPKGTRIESKELRKKMQKRLAELGVIEPNEELPISSLRLARGLNRVMGGKIREYKEREEETKNPGETR